MDAKLCRGEFYALESERASSAARVRCAAAGDTISIWGLAGCGSAQSEERTGGVLRFVLLPANHDRSQSEAFLRARAQGKRGLAGGCLCVLSCPLSEQLRRDGVVKVKKAAHTQTPTQEPTRWNFRRLWKGMSASTMNNNNHELIYSARMHGCPYQSKATLHRP
jgi:hypothetical protein